MTLRKKSQITLIIILGLVIFISISFVFYLVSTTSKKQVERENIQAKETRMNVQPIIEYTTQCLNRISKDALVNIGKQAGYLYASEGGLSIDFDPNDKGIYYLDYGGKKVPYSILYPPNKGVKSLFPLFNTAPQSIESQLETYNKNNIIICTDFTIFEGYEIKLESGRKSDVVIGTNDVNFRLEHPLDIAFFDEKTKIKDFNSKQSIRFRKIYTFVNSLIKNDIDDINFNIDTEPSSGEFTIDVVKDVFNHDDVIIVRDTKSKILDKNYEFIFARRNRPPELQPIPSPISIDSPINNLNVLITKLNLRSSDRDEDSISDGSLEYIITYTDLSPLFFSDFTSGSNHNLRIQVGDFEHRSNSQDIIVNIN